MTPTVGMQLRLGLDVAEAVERVAGRGGKTKYITELIRRDLQRRGELPADKRKGAK